MGSSTMDGSGGQTAVPRIDSLRDYLNTSGQPFTIPQLGIAVHNGTARLQSGRFVDGVEVESLLERGTEAQDGPLEGPPYRGVSTVLIGASAVAAMFFPPAMIGAVIFGMTQSANGDLIIGVDGHRITNAFELAEEVAEDKTGDTAYVAIVRNGRRLQVPVRVR